MSFWARLGNSQLPMLSLQMLGVVCTYRLYSREPKL